MSPLLGRLVFAPDDRLYESFRQLCTITACMRVALLSVQTDTVARAGDSIFRSKFGTDLYMPGRGPVEMAMNNEKPDQIYFDIKSSGAIKLPDVPPLAKQSSLIVLSDSLAAMTFVGFYEANLDWIESAAGYTSDRQMWPDIINFGRIIRNAVSHAGKIHFANPKASAVSWHSFNYSPKDQGRAIIGAEFHLAELVFLMIEISQLLDRDGAPVN